MSKPWFYPDRVSARAGEVVRIFASGPEPEVTLTITHLGASETVVTVFDNIRIADVPTPDHADAKGCAWPEVFLRGRPGLALRLSGFADDRCDRRVDASLLRRAPSARRRAPC